MESLTQGTVEKARAYAPWRSNLSWWIVLIEGIIIGVLGIVILFDPGRSAVNLALIMAGALGVLGFLHLWRLYRQQIPGNLAVTVAIRASIAAYTGFIIVSLYLLNLLTIDAGAIAFGVGGLLFGLTGFWVFYRSASPRRRQPLVEGIFYTIVGPVMLYAYFGGRGAVATATAIIGWFSLAVGLVLVGFALYRRGQMAAKDAETTSANDTPGQDASMAGEASARSGASAPAEPIAPPPDPDPVASAPSADDDSAESSQKTP